MKQELKKAIIYLITAVATALSIVWGLSSCTVMRQVTTVAESIQKGDTSVVVQTKTIEKYTANKQTL